MENIKNQDLIDSVLAQIEADYLENDFICLNEMLLQLIKQNEYLNKPTMFGYLSESGQKNLMEKE